MANSILKWCKTKFLNGYRHINVEASEEMCGNRSDTETLVRESEKEFLLTTPTPDPTLTPMMGEDVPPISPSLRDDDYPYIRNSSGPRKHNLQWTLNQQDSTGRCMDTYLEEVTCDLSISGGSAERQEFAFTLYDFDGHGRVTKDDIASLVQTIYEAVGTSLSLPPCGSRTIRVKLTVAPDVPSNDPSLRLNGPNTASTTPKDSPRNPLNDSYSPRTFHDSSSSPGDSPRMMDDDNSPIISPRKDEGIEVSPRTPRMDDEICPRTPRKDCRRRRRRRSTFHRQELLQIIQENMEKNNLYYPPLQYRYHSQRRRRKICDCGYHCGSPPDPATLKAKLLECECLCNCCCNSNNMDKVDANNTCNNRHNCSNTSNNKNYSSHKVRHNRSRSHDYTTDSPHVFRHQLLDNNTHQPLPPSNTPDRPTSPNNRSTSPKITNQHHHEHNHLNPQIIYHARSRSCEANDSSELCHINIPHLFNSKKKNSDSLLHQHKYRHRNDEHNRAMSQVVAWLERSTFKDGVKKTFNDNIGIIANTNNGSKDNYNNNNNNNCGHAHHVHQHYHHHYHHYPTAPSLII